MPPHDSRADTYDGVLYIKKPSLLQAYSIVYLRFDKGNENAPTGRYP